MAKPIIYVSDKKAEINGARVEIMTALTHLFEGLVNNNVTTKEELHEAVDMAFMNDKELNQLVKEKMNKLLEEMRKHMGIEENE